MIPTIEIAPLFGPAAPARDRTDAAILRAATGTGFMAISGPPELIAATPQMRAELLRLFELPAEQTALLSRRKFAPGNPNVYRGWFPLQPGFVTCKEGIDIGPNIARPASGLGGPDPLLEPTPLPDEAALPGWRAAAVQYYRAMETLGRAMMQSVARGLSLPETQFDAAFQGGISTLRLLHYPRRAVASLEDAEGAWTTHLGQRRLLSGAAHIDSGFVTLLAQDGVEGLQAQDPSGAWIDVPPHEGTLAVNFGGLLERWTGGRIRATRHRVLGSDRARCSIPFFYEPRVDTVIAPLPGAEPFAPFQHGDHLWAAITRFVEFQGLEALRAPRAAIR